MNYKIRDTNDFMFGTLPQFKNFEVYTGMEIYDILEDNIDILPMYKTKNLSISKQEYSVPTKLPKGFSKYKKFSLALKNKLDKRVWFNPSSIKQYSLTEKPNYRTEQGFSTTLIAEHYIRSIKTSNLFLFLKIPYEFLRDHLQYNVALANVQQYYQAIDTIEEITVENLIKMQDEYDLIFPDKIAYTGLNENKSSHSFIWRRDMFPYMVYSLSKYGYYNPIISTKQQVAFFGGTHRLTCGPAVKRDVPYLFLLPEALKNYEVLHFITPPCMLGGQEMLLRICMYKKTVEGWYIQEEQFKTSPTEFRLDELAAPTKTTYISVMAKLYANKTPDFTWIL